MSVTNVLEEIMQLTGEPAQPTAPGYHSVDALLTTALPDSGKQRLEDASGQCLKTRALQSADMCVLLFLKM